MSKLEELIQQYCPDGVEYKRLRELANVAIGEFVRKDKQNPDAPYPVYNGGCSNTGFYEQFNMKAPKVIMSARGAGAGFVNYIDQDFWAGNSCYAISPQTNRITIKYLYYYLKHNETAFLSNQQKGGIPAVSKKQVEDFSIPVPPLPVQEEIVRILDTFTELQAELQAELQKRKQQYEYYRDKLLSFSNLSDWGQNVSVEWKKLGEVADLGTGSHNTQDGLVEGKYPFYTRGSEILYFNDYDYDETAIITAGDGAGVGKVFHFVQGKYALHQRAYRIVPNENIMLARFVYYYIGATFYNYIMKSSVSSSVVSIRKPMMVNYPIPVPSLSEQQRIVNILDRFDALTTDITAGLPAEIEARRKQYEYYRDRLLTFKQKA